VPRYGDVDGGGGKESENFGPGQKLPRPTMSERQNSRQMVLPGTESEADREERRNEAEEMALFLRDEKMVEAAGSSGEGLLAPHIGDMRASSPNMQLTRENVGKLQEEQKREGDFPQGWPKLERETSNETSNISSDEDVPRTKGERPRRQRRWHDSQTTVTGL